MKSMRQRTVSGPFVAANLGGRCWQLATASPQPAQIHLRVAAGASCEPLEPSAGIERIELQWHAAGVTVRVTRSDHVGTFEAETAIIHEARGDLYASLPLAKFDTRARRFWSRVFLLIRVPGGGYLLRWIARRAR